MTRVVNIMLTNDYDCYIGRAGHGESGYFGNSHPIGFCKICNIVHNRKQCIEAYKKDFYERIEKDEEFKRRILELKDLTLGCFCKQPNKDIPCHGDIISEYLDNLK